MSKSNNGARQRKRFMDTHGGLSLGDLNNYLRVKFGDASYHGDLYAKVAQGLIIDSVENIYQQTSKKFAIQNSAHIIKTVADWRIANNGISLRNFKRDSKCKTFIVGDVTEVNNSSAIKKVQRSPNPKKIARPPKVVKQRGWNVKVTKFYTPDTSYNYRKLSYEEANAPEFLESFEWRTLRMAVLSKYGSACMCCGAKPDSGRGIFANVDHILSRRKRPDLALCFDNLQVLCTACNHGKANWDETDWRPKDGKTNSVVYVDEPVEQEQDTEYVDMATVRFLRDIAK